MSRDTFPTGTLNHYTIEGREIQAGDQFGLKLVACIWQGWNGWCVFMGPPDWTDQKVAAQGDEVPEKVAKMLFPTLAALKRIYSNC
jgi:hypothetical protein